MMTDDPEPAPHYFADAVRQGEIILRKRWQRFVFIAGLFGFVLLAMIVGWIYRS